MNSDLFIDQNKHPNISLDPQSTKLNKSQVSVVCRIKPLITSQPQIQIKIDKENAQIQITQQRQQTTKTFSFNKIYTDETQKQFVQQTCRPILENILQNKKGYLIFSYGVTNSGKTHTILGNQKQPGILPFLVRKLSTFSQVHISAIQLYNDQFFSLSTKKKITPKQIGGFLDFHDCSISQVINCQNMDEKFKNYITNRTHGDTKINNKSSRSHAIFRIQVNNIVIGVVDLAGSQRTNRVIADIDETLNINKSLLCLGRCIKALNQNRDPPAPIPYRESKLTRVLIEYFAARVQVLMVANISQAQEHFHQNMKVLDYAIMAKDIRHCSTINSLMKSKSKKKICSKIDVFEALSKSQKRQNKVQYKSLKSSRKIISNSMDYSNDIQSLKLQNQKYLRLIRKLELQQNLRKLQGSLEAHEYYENMIDVQAQKFQQQKLQQIKAYTYQSPVHQKRPNYRSFGIGTSPIQTKQQKQQQLQKIKEQLKRIIQQQRKAQQVNQQTFITTSFKKKHQQQDYQMKTPVKKSGSVVLDPIQGQSFIKKSCKSIYDSVKKILKGNLQANSLKKISAPKSNMKSHQISLKKQMKLCSYAIDVFFEPQQTNQSSRVNFSFGQKQLERTSFGVQVDFQDDQVIQQRKLVQIQVQTEDQIVLNDLDSENVCSELQICQKVTELSVRNSVVIQQSLREDKSDDETQQMVKENIQLKQKNDQKKDKKAKTKRTKAKRDVDRIKRIAQTRKMAAKLCRDNSRTPLKKRLRNRQKLN